MRNFLIVLFAIAGVAACSSSDTDEPSAGAADTERWLAGDHHVHSHYSVGWTRKGVAEDDSPPTFRIGGDAINSIGENVEQARAFGLDWMVNTDHGGPGHSKINLELAYPELLETRALFPEMILFHGMEFDTPGAEHSSLIIPKTEDEAQTLFEIESGYNKREPYPFDPKWDTEARMDEALRFMRTYEDRPVIFVNHPSRTATAEAAGKVSPEELHRWNDIAPDIVVGMEGGIGHQARALRPDWSLVSSAPRAGYEGVSTYGGYDPMTATLGGLWDAMLGHGRHWWVTATSDSHRHWHHGGDDFWPGEYAKTYVFARQNYASVLAALRAGKIFVTTGDLISSLDMTVTASGDQHTATFGDTLTVAQGQDVHVSIAFTDPEAPNAGGHTPSVARLDVIIGEIDPQRMSGLDHNPTARVLKRIPRDELRQSQEHFSYQFTMPALEGPYYIRLRGTNGYETEPEPDPHGEDPWQDLWFYSNPVFLNVERTD